MGMFEHRNPTREEYAATERTKQAFKDQTDINKILQKAQIKGGLSHVQKYPHAVYGEFDGEMDLLTAHTRLAKAQTIFDDLPAEVRREFSNDALKFVKWAGSQTAEQLVEKIPEIAKPGSYFPNPVQRTVEPSVDTSTESAPPPEPASSEPAAGE